VTGDPQAMKRRLSPVEASQSPTFPSAAPVINLNMHEKKRDRHRYQRQTRAKREHLPHSFEYCDRYVNPSWETAMQVTAPKWWGAMPVQQTTNKKNDVKKKNSKKNKRFGSFISILPFLISHFFSFTLEP
jgi:hypothetical protein